ncbi:LysR family transcriptional regulator [Clostridium sp. MSJ-11]|uniref:LysR family transcriptional regulator n=1 Tax=Clostridium mobile TaxID=2841512 RepID=A0ABS6EDT9_9CLOT|nr:LysR family transcriptional regulator [Clostridium mobile]MBU5483359.1 LysR family transcriptional regulator [Clostridium mobile]
MDIRLINAFITVATLHNFTQAADQLGYAQSSVTSQIQMLEKELGVRLFDRLGKKVCLTPEGEEFLIYARELLCSWEKAKGLLSSSKFPRGILTIGADESICAAKLPKLLEEYHKQYPEVEFSIKIGSTDELEIWLKENQIDIAVLLDRAWHAPELKVEIQREESLALLVSPDHPLAYKESVFPHDVSNYPMLLVSHGCCCQNLFQAVMEDARETFRTMLETGSVQTLKQFAMLGFGITVLPLYEAHDEIAAHRLAKLNWAGKDLKLFIQVVHHRDKWISPSIEAFLKICEDIEW